MGRSVGRFASELPRRTTGQRLSMLMANQRVTSIRLAANLRIQESTLVNFCKGHRNIPSDVVAAMARELDTNVAFLLGSSEDSRPGEVILGEARLREEGWRAVNTSHRR